MNSRRPKATTRSSAIPTLATILAGAALSAGCQRAEALARPFSQNTAQNTAQTSPQSTPQNPREVLQAQRAVPGLPPQAMTIPPSPEELNNRRVYNSTNIMGGLGAVGPELE